MTYREVILAAGRAYLTEVLTQANGNIAAAAKLAGLSRTGLYKAVLKHGIAISVERKVVCNPSANSGKIRTIRQSWHGLNR